MGALQARATHPSARASAAPRAHPRKPRPGRTRAGAAWSAGGVAVSGHSVQRAMRAGAPRALRSAARARLRAATPSKGTPSDAARPPPGQPTKCNHAGKVHPWSQLAAPASMQGAAAASSQGNGAQHNPCAQSPQTALFLHDSTFTKHVRDWEAGGGKTLFQICSHGCHGSGGEWRQTAPDAERKAQSWRIKLIIHVNH